MSNPVERDRPDLKIRRAIIEAKRDEFRAMAYSAEVEVESLEAQTAVGAAEMREKKALLAELRSKATNCYAAARRMDAMLEELDESPVAPVATMTEGGDQ